MGRLGESNEARGFESGRVVWQFGSLAGRGKAPRSRGGSQFASFREHGILVGSFFPRSHPSGELKM